MSKDDSHEGDYLPPPQLVRQVANEEAEPDRTWKSCCFSANVAAVKYFSTLLISLTVLLFACFMAFNEKSERALWVSMISGIVGQYMPSPFIH